MAKLTKAEIKNHNIAMEMINSDRRLTIDDKMFIIENYHEGSSTNNAELGAFFTPLGLCRDFCVDANTGGTVIDLCSGIGGLSFALLHLGGYSTPTRIVCVERNYSYYEVGKRLLPEAEWIYGDALTEEFDCIFDTAISNPPFGKIKTSDYTGKYTGAEFEYKVIDRASQIARSGFFIIPQESANFKYSGVRCYTDKDISSKCKKFLDQTGLDMQPGCGVDTSIYLKQWRGVSPMCEIVCFEFEPEIKKENKITFDFRIE